MKIICVATQKGGAGKTTTAAALAQVATFKGKRALLVDTDAQASAALIYGADITQPGVVDILSGKRGDIQHTSAGDIIAPGRNIEQFHAPDTAEGNRLLFEALQQVTGVYDYCFVDTAPGLSAMLVQALAAADCVIIPAAADSLGLSGLRLIIETISAVKKICNPGLFVAGVVLTKHNERALLKRQYAELFKEQCSVLGVPFAQTFIREAVALQEAQATRQSLYMYAPDSNPAQDYAALFDELNI